MTAVPTDQARAQQLAEALMQRANLALTVDHAQALALLAKVLYRHPPPGSRHGTLVLNAMLPREGRYTAAELAVRRLLCSGNAPTREAVAGALRQAEESVSAWTAHRDRLRPLVDSQGPAAAAAVEGLWRARGKAPSPRLLGCGWAGNPGTSGRWSACSSRRSGWRTGTGG